MEGTPQEPRFCRVRSFSGSHFQGPCGFPGFPAAAEGRLPRFCPGASTTRISQGGATKSSPAEGHVPRFRQQQEPEELWRSMWAFSGGHILEKGPPPRSAKNVLQALYLMTKFNVAKSGCGFPRIPPLRGRPGRSLCVAPLKEELWESMWPFSGGHIL